MWSLLDARARTVMILFFIALFIIFMFIDKDLKEGSVKVE